MQEEGQKKRGRKSHDPSQFTMRPAKEESCAPPGHVIRSVACKEIRNCPVFWYVLRFCLLSLYHWRKGGNLRLMSLHRSPQKRTKRGRVVFFVERGVQPDFDYANTGRSIKPRLNDRAATPKPSSSPLQALIGADGRAC